MNTEEILTEIEQITCRVVKDINHSSYSTGFNLDFSFYDDRHMIKVVYSPYGKSWRVTHKDRPQDTELYYHMHSKKEVADFIHYYLYRDKESPEVE